MTDIKQIARLANVSAATVSRVLNDHPYVRAETREKVLQIVAQEHYFPNALAANLRRKTSDVIGYLQFGRPHLEDSRMAQRAETVLLEAGFKTFLCNADDAEQRVRFFLDEMIGQRVAGVILCPQGNDARALEARAELEQAGVVSILLGAQSAPRGVSSVSVDWTQGWDLALDHLSNLGHRHIAWLTTDQGSPLPEASARIGSKIVLHPIPVPADGITSFDIDSLVDALAQSDNRITALICSSEQIAARANQVFSARSIKVPEQMSILCFGGTDFGRMILPQMTVIARPVEELGLNCAQQLLNLISFPQAAARQMAIENAFRRGESTARCPSEKI